MKQGAGIVPKSGIMTKLELAVKSITSVKSNLFLIPALILVSTLLPTHNVFAEEAHHDAQHTFHKNTVGVFVGITGEDRRERAITLALEYERRINEDFGIGFVVERAFGDLDFNVYIAGLTYHSGPWKYYLGVGIESSDHHDDEALARVGVEYAFEVGSFEIAPQLSVDIVDGDAVIIFGAVFAKGF